MKLFKFQRPTIVRVDIVKKGVSKKDAEGKTFSLDERDSEKVSNELKRILSEETSVRINALEQPTKVIVQCYEHDGSNKKNYKVFTVYNLTVGQIHTILLNNIEK